MLDDGYVRIPGGVVQPTPTPSVKPTPTPSVKPTPTPSGGATTLSIDKKIGKGNDIRDKFSAGIGELVGIVINVTNTGSVPASNAVIGDVLPPNLRYVPNSTTLNGNPVSEDGITVPVTIGNINPGASHQVTLQATVIDLESNKLSIGSLIQNDAQADADNADKVFDTAFVEVDSITNIDISVVKTVKNITAGGSEFTDSVNAGPGDTVEFKIVLSGATGTATHVELGDVIPYGLTYVAGSTTLNGTSSPKNAISEPILFETLTSSQTNTVTLRATVADLVEFGVGETTPLENLVRVQGYNTALIADKAIVNVVRAPNNAKLSIDKTAKNITNGDSSYADTINAKAGDTVEFKIIVSNTGSTVSFATVVGDVLPAGFTYTTGSTKLNGSSITADGVTNPVSVGDLKPSESHTITLQAKVNTGYFNGNVIVQNDGHGVSANAIRVTDKALINITGGGQGSIWIQKTGRDTTRGDSTTQVTLSTLASHEIEFSIKIGNSGSSTVNNVIVRDIMPSRITYIGNVKVDGVSNNGSLISGINIGSISNGQTKTTTFTARVADQNQFSTLSTSLINTALVRADEISEFGDDMPITVTINVGTVPTGFDTVAVAMLVAVGITGMFIVGSRTSIFGRYQYAGMFGLTGISDTLREYRSHITVALVAITVIASVMLFATGEQSVQIVNDKAQQQTQDANLLDAIKRGFGK